MFSGQELSFAARRGAFAPLLLLAFNPSPAFAHDAPKGWSYPFSCCSGFDCREVPVQAISEKPEGYVIKGTGEVVSYADARLKSSPNGEYHWCSVAGPMIPGRSVFSCRRTRFERASRKAVADLSHRASQCPIIVQCNTT